MRNKKEPLYIFYILVIVIHDKLSVTTDRSESALTNKLVGSNILHVP